MGALEIVFPLKPLKMKIDVEVNTQKLPGIAFGIICEVCKESNKITFSNVGIVFLCWVIVLDLKGRGIHKYFLLGLIFISIIICFIALILAFIVWCLTLSDDFDGSEKFASTLIECYNNIL